MIMGAHFYPAEAVWDQWNRLNPGVEHPGCPLLTRYGVASVRRLNPKLITRLCDTGHLPTVTIPGGRPRIPETSLLGFRRLLEQVARNGGVEAFAQEAGIHPATAYRVLRGFGVQGWWQR